MVDERMNDTPCLFDDRAMSPEGMVSATQIGTFLACRRRWEYSYREGLRQRRERDYLTVGKMCHAGMEAAMRERWERAMDGTDPDLQDLIEVGSAAVRREFDEHMAVSDMDGDLGQEDLLQRAEAVFAEALEEFDPLRWMPITVIRDGEAAPALELHFCVPCAPCAGLHGFIDAILVDQNTGQTWCVDYKFRRTLAADDDERFSLQNAVYMMACRRMGIDVAGTITWQRYSSPSSDPRINSDGSVSRSRIRCTWRHFRRFVEDMGLDPSDYADMEAKLADVEMYRATWEIRSDDMVGRVWAQIVEPSAAAIVDAMSRDHGREIPSMDPWACRLCSYQSLCQAELRGYDAEFVRSEEYTLKDHRQ